MKVKLYYRQSIRISVSIPSWMETTINNWITGELSNYTFINPCLTFYDCYPRWVITKQFKKAVQWAFENLKNNAVYLNLSLLQNVTKYWGLPGCRGHWKSRALYSWEVVKPLYSWVGDMGKFEACAYSLLGHFKKSRFKLDGIGRGVSVKL